MRVPDKNPPGSGSPTRAGVMRYSPGNVPGNRERSFRDELIR